VIVIPREAVWARVRKEKAEDENDSDLSTAGDAAVYIIVSVTFPGGRFSNESSAVCRKNCLDGITDKSFRLLFGLWTD